MTETPTPPGRRSRRATDPQADSAATGRRAALRRGRRVDLLVALGVVLPAVTAIALVVIGEEERTAPAGSPPTDAALTSLSLVCPSPVATRGAGVRAARAPEVPGGTVQVRLADPAGPAQARARLESAGDLDVPARGSVAVPDASGAVALSADGEAAPGLVAGRTERAAAVPECRAPSYDEWFVGLGASARYASTLELVNPDPGDAVVDVVLHGPDGILEEPGLRGVQVPGHSVRRLDLSRIAPRTALTAAHVTSVRGRVVTSAPTTRDPLGGGVVSTDFLPAVAAPSTDSLILGLPQRPGSAMLVVANPGADEARVTPRLVTAEATFAPVGAPEITVPPRSAVQVRLDELLRDDAAEGAVGLRLTSTTATVASLRLTVGSDLALLAPVPQLREPTTTVVPRGAKTLQLAGATRAGVVRVRSYGADGAELADKSVDVRTDTAATLRLPSAAVSVQVEPRDTPISGVVSLPGQAPTSLATVRLRPAELRARIPVVAPDQLQP
ncbi:hypothetical protein KG112_01905 [Nocardioides sp. zg-ZUI104]|uniref:DUF5719 family protein n=1 Tax=Nocardioides faecalis TaxID=2803858 RepID=UPI001BCC3681|nr:DUF5719 family protein [Nocardioides faecalis]MBS4751561.1 hypothetical protein [Nocardioides faecalis]